jgi:hypothetical protein
MENKVVKLNRVETRKNNLKLNNNSNLLRLEIALNDLWELNKAKQSGAINRTECHLCKSKIIKKLFYTG